jgi:hypothetical protein
MQKVNKEELSVLTCDDIILAVLDESLRKVEPLVIGFEREAKSVRNLALRLSINERNDYIRRINMAKEAMLI